MNSLRHRQKPITRFLQSVKMLIHLKTFVKLITNYLAANLFATSLQFTTFQKAAI